jgi:hypothetical protein
MRKLAVEMDMALSDGTLPLDLIVVTNEQFQRDKDRLGTIVQPAVCEGRVLYGRTA